MMIAAIGMAQVVPMVLGEKHAMLRVGGAKYVLLPVQETEEIAAIAVLDGRNEMVQRINVKLAVDRVDYWVPYELKNARLLDIEFHGDRRQKGAVGGKKSNFLTHSIRPTASASARCITTRRCTAG